MSTYSAISFQNASSPLMEELIFFHDHTMTMLTLITIVISYSMLSIFKDLNLNKSMTESQPLEFFWTVSPTIILILIGMPSIRLLYMLDEVFNPLITMKVMGHQWYWSYEYSDFLNTEFDSFMKLHKTPDMSRLMDVDNRIIMPFNTQIRALISSTDVLHSWTIPTMGIKVDAVPGRLNQLNFLSTRPGIFYGQCSEICGANHSFMPIVIETINMNMFIKWIYKNM